MIRAALAGMVLSAAPALAQDLVFSPAQTEACLAGAGTLDLMHACVGQSARACMENTIGGETTVGMGACLERERVYWDGRLNAAYQQQMTKSKKVDEEMSELGATVPSQSKALRNMQRAWIPYRDARCEYDYSQWGGGTGGGPAYTHCLMSVTGEQALYLEEAGLGD